MHIHALDAYRPQESLIHRLDARVKLVLAVCFIVATVLTPDGSWPSYAALTLLVLAVVAISRLGVGFVLRRSLAALPFALAAMTVVFTVPGRSLWAVQVLGRTFSASDAGLVRFAGILVESWLSVQAAIVLTASTPFPSLLQAMRSLRVPKVLVTIVGFAYRYIFVIADEVMRMMRARAARSGSLQGRGGGNVLWRARVAGGMAGSLFLRSIARSERIYDAMVARGYDGEVRVLRPPALHPGDVGLGFVFALLLVAIQVLARM